MPVTIHLPDPDPRRLQPTLSPLAELSAALHVLTSPGHHLFLADWRERVQATIAPALAADLDDLAFLWDGYRANFFLLDQPGLPAVRTLDDELAVLAGLAPDAFATEALQPLGTRRGEPLAAGRTPGEGSDQLLAHARARGGRAEATAVTLLSTPADVRDHLVEVLSAVRVAFFDDEWAGLRPSLHQAVEAARTILATRGAVELLAGLGHGLHRVDDRTVSVDKTWDAGMVVDGDRRLLVLPSLLCHPHVLVQPNPVWPYAVQYPVHRRAPTRALPPLEVTERRLEALADPSRRELVALLANEDRSTQELAGLSGLTPPTVSRHLGVLREAGLVQVRQQGHFRLHHLDLEAVSGLGQALVASLLR